MGYSHVNGVRSFFSTYTWYTSILFLAIYLVLREPHHFTDPCPSATRPFNSSKNPTYFVHITDVHISHKQGRNNRNFMNALEFSKKSKTNTLINTGDLVDNWKFHGKVVKESSQNLRDQEIYQKLSKDTGPLISLYVDQSGNHDLFDVYSFGSKKMHFLKYSNYYLNLSNITYEKYLVSTVTAEDCIFVIINPQLFPPSRALTDLFVYPNRKNLDTIENAIINACKTNLSVVVLNHFPIDQWFSVKSSLGHSFKDMISIYDISIALDGHTHPSIFHPQHHGTSLEVIGSDTKQHNNLGIVTIDNGNINYAAFKCNNDPKAVVTYPISYDVASRQTVFNNQKIDIRVLAFTEEPVKIYADGHLMEFDRLVKPGVSLYHYENTFPFGMNTIEFTGYFDNRLTFYVGDILPSHYEFLGNLYNLFFSVHPIFILLMISFITITFPIPFELKYERIKRFAHDKLTWIFNGHSTVLQFILNCTIFGPLIVRWRFNRMPLYVRVTMFLVIFLPYVCPVVVQTIDGHLGILTIYGYYNGGHNTPTIWGPIFSLIHMWFEVAPITIFSSMLALSSYWTNWFILDFMFLFLGLAVCFGFTYFKLSEATKIVFWASNPLFVLCPIALLLMLVIWRRIGKRPDFSDIVVDHSTNEDLLTSEVCQINPLVN